MIKHSHTVLIPDTRCKQTDVFLQPYVAFPDAQSVVGKSVEVYKDHGNSVEQWITKEPKGLGTGRCGYRIFNPWTHHLSIFIIVLTCFKHIDNYGTWDEVRYTLWLFNIAMENDPFTNDFPIKTLIYSGFSMAMLNNQMVSEVKNE